MKSQNIVRDKGELSSTPRLTGKEEEASPSTSTDMERFRENYK